ncbi:MAG: hypothetical protein JXQ75_23285 [Phycisphaerae bacterium]|nr:hypothetical protein [Phycisphaerae bacterium]
MDSTVDAEGIDRRAFLSTLGRFTGGACMACGLGPLASNVFAGGPAQRFTHEARFYERLPNGRVQCFLCPFN